MSATTEVDLVAIRNVPPAKDPAPAAAAMLAAFPGERQTWWSRGETIVAGMGSAISYASSGPGRFSSLARRVLPGPIAFAGGNFNGKGWPGFPAAEMWVPRIAFVVEGGDARLLAYGEDSEGLLDRAAEAISDADRFDLRAPRLRAVSSRLVPDDDGWDEAFAGAAERIDAGALEKVVLSRRLTLETDAPPWPAGLAATLGRAYPDCYTYAISFGNTAFVGASPELLVEVDGDQVRSAPSAGTAAAGTAEDQLFYPKTIREQRVVVDAVIERLSGFCVDIQAESPSAENAGPVRHLVSHVSGRLSRPANVMDLVEALHPTPAVGGMPVQEAVRFIDETERFARGWYAGPIGIVRAGGGTFAIALRGALIRPRSVSLFAGAGIVEGSQADAEKREIEMKLEAVASVLGVRL